MTGPDYRTPESGDEGYCRVCGQWCKYPYPGYYQDAVCSRECFDEWKWRDWLQTLGKPYYPKGCTYRQCQFVPKCGGGCVLLKGAADDRP